MDALGNANSVGDTYTNHDNIIRQIKSYQTFVNVLTPSTNQMLLQFYFPSQVGTNRDIRGLYTSFTGDPFVTWTIENQEPETTNYLNITETRSDYSKTEYLERTFQSDGMTWTLTQGDDDAIIGH